MATTAFATVFLMEMGDKTQLATMSLAASTRKPWAVLLGGSLALVAVTGVSVVLGESLLRLAPERAVRRCSAVLLVAAGAWVWLKS
ncbi:MAG: TMEM165/GDT1 family protein [Elusimicrobia bacterium]|nr:TMEM165/GDT1 family protein [Elusimicrobiota bacterium]